MDEAARLAEAMGGKLHLVAAYEPLRGAKIVGARKGAAKVWELKPDAEVQSVIQEAESTGCGSRASTSSRIRSRAIQPTRCWRLPRSSQGANQIVVGNRGMHGMTRVLGSVPNKVSHRASCNVLIVATAEA